MDEKSEHEEIFLILDLRVDYTNSSIKGFFVGYYKALLI
jgi:hypothetical protein